MLGKVIKIFKYQKRERIIIVISIVYKRACALHESRLRKSQHCMNQAPRWRKKHS